MGKSIYLTSNGCQTAQADSSLLASACTKLGYDTDTDPKAADIIVLNLCSFQAEAYKDSIELYRTMHSLRKPGARLVITGCAANIQKGSIRKDMPNADDIVANVADLALELGSLPQSTEVPTRYHNSANLLEITVERSCASKCTFCAIPRGRGPLASYSIESIINTVQSFPNRPTVTLIGEDVGAYGRDIDSSLTALLSELYSIGNKIKINVLNPWWFLPYAQKNGNLLEKIAEGTQQRKLFPYLGLPLQSGSDSVLKRMKRNYTSQDYRSIVKSLQAATPEIGFGTDIIVGFPGETDSEFRETSALLEEIDFKFFGIWTYTDMPGTEASRLPGKVPEEIIRKRLLHLEGLVAAKELSKRGMSSIKELIEHNVKLPLITNDRACKRLPIVEAKQ